ncbi:MAG: PAS domain S-box protein [Candidatus Latescibacteria bacterium]|nr:PAS domain S-box protein [Candidatus Latescibacterota bacterium]
MNDVDSSLMNLLDHLPGMVYRCRNDRDWTMKFVSQGSVELTGYSPTELLDNGKIAYGQLIHPEDRDTVWDTVQQALADQAAFQVGYRLRTPETEKWVWEQGRGIFSPEGELLHLEGFISDITERKRAEQSLRESEEQLRSVVNNVIDGIITIDEEGRINSFNQAAEEIFGYLESDLLGQNVRLLMPQPYRQEHDGYLAQYRQTGAKKIIGHGRQVMGQRKDGEVFPIDLAVCEFWTKDKRYFTGIIRDITGRKLLEDQLLQAQKMESVGRLAGSIAHDFNNQLGIILFDVDMMLDLLTEQDPLYEDLLKIRKVILRSAGLTRQLLLFSRRQPMEMQPLVLNHQIGELQRMLDRLLGEAITVEIDLPPNLATVRADGGNLDQLMINLAINARDAMPEGGTLAIQTRNVEIDATYCKGHSQARPGPFVRLSITDSGTGMDEATAKQIFEPFFTTKEVGKGTGLGLSVVYGIVQAHEGWITVSSQPDQGTTFEIYLPALVTAGDRDAFASPQRDAAQLTGNKERVLLAEDEDELRERLEKLLVKQGYLVTACGTATQVREAFAARQSNFDLFISDAVLPDGRGPELITEFLAAEPAMPALLITGYVEDWESQLEKLKLPILQKPFAVAVLLEKVKQLLGSR